MNRFLAFLDRHWLPISLACIVILAIIAMAGCKRGSAQERAASDQDRSAALADSAAKAASIASGKAARAQALTTEAEKDPSQAAAAAAARIEAAQALAEAQSLERFALMSRDQARQSSRDAQIERARDQAEAERRAWVRWCRWLGLAAVALGGLVGGIVAFWLKAPRLGLIAGGSLIGTGFLVVGFAATASWLPAVLVLALVAGLIAWAWQHRRDLGLAEALSQALDASEVPAGNDGMRLQVNAKRALGTALDASGRRPRLNRLRGQHRRWGQP